MDNASCLHLFFLYNLVMEKLLTALKSRTVWTVVVLFLVSGVNAVQSYVPAGYLEPVQGLLALLAVYFRVNPRV